MTMDMTPEREDAVLSKWGARTATESEKATLQRWLVTQGEAPEEDKRAPWQKWTPASTFASGALLGYGPEAAAYGYALKQILRTGTNQNFQKDYEFALNSARSEKAQVAEKAPWTHGLAEVAGNLATTVPATMLGGAALAGGGGVLLNAMRSSPLLARLVPAAEQAGKFVSGGFKGGPFGIGTGASRAVGGAAQGATGAAMLEHQSDAPLLDQMLVGTLLGGAVGAGAPALLEGGRKLGKAVGALVGPFTDKGQNTIVNRLISRFGEGGNTVPAASPVAGSEPTLAQATGNPGIAGLERQVKALHPNEFEAVELGNERVRQATINSVRGTRSDIDNLATQRDTITTPLREAAFKNKVDVNPRSLVKYIDDTLESPAGQSDSLRKAMTEIRQKLVMDNPIEDRIANASARVKPSFINNARMNAADQDALNSARKLLNQAKSGKIDEAELISQLNGIATKSKNATSVMADVLKDIKSGPTKMQMDAEQLYGIRKALAKDMGPLSASEQSHYRAAAAELKPLLDRFDSVIEKGAPGFKNYMKTFSDLSKPIDVKEKLQSLDLFDANGNLTLSKVDSAIKNIEKEVGKPGVRKAKSIEQDVMDQLKAVRDDLRLKTGTGKGKAVGSDTVQNIMINNLMEQMGVEGGLGKFGTNLIARVLSPLYKNANEDMQLKLLQALLSPQTPIQPYVASGAGNSIVNRIVNNPLMQRLPAAVPSLTSQ